MIRAIMYHYVRHHEDKLPYFRYLDVENFKRQINYLEEEFGVLTYEEAVEIFTSKKIPQSSVGKCLLTFDDGMSDHYKYVYPYLKEKNICGVFFIPGAPYLKNIVLDVHKVHQLIGSFEAKELLASLLSIVDDSDISENDKSSFQNLTYLSHKDQNEINLFKKILNYYVKYEKRETIIKKLCLKYDIVVDTSFYISKDQIKEMSKNKMIIGNHTGHHKVLSRLNYDDQKSEIAETYNLLEKIIEKKLSPKTFCYPYGGSHTYNENTLDILKKCNTDIAISVDHRTIIDDDIKNKPLELPRFDCNQFKYGKISIGNIDTNLRDAL